MYSRQARVVHKGSTCGAPASAVAAAGVCNTGAEEYDGLAAFGAFATTASSVPGTGGSPSAIGAVLPAGDEYTCCDERS